MVAEPSRGPAARRRRPDPVELPRTARLTVPRLSDDLAERIRRLIISEDIAEGARLPPERDLAERFGASRPTVSQALRALSLMGLVEIRRGRAPTWSAAPRRWSPRRSTSCSTSTSARSAT